MESSRSYANVKCKGKSGLLMVTPSQLIFTPEDGSRAISWPWGSIQKHLVKTVQVDRHLIKLVFANLPAVVLEVSTRQEVDQIRRDVSAARAESASKQPGDDDAPPAANLPGSVQDHTNKLRAQNRNGQTLTFLPSGKSRALRPNQKAVPLTPFQAASRNTHSRGTDSINSSLRQTTSEDSKKKQCPPNRTRSGQSSTGSRESKEDKKPAGTSAAAVAALPKQQQSAPAQRRRQPRTPRKTAAGLPDQSNRKKPAPSQRQRPAERKAQDSPPSPKAGASLTSGSQSHEETKAQSKPRRRGSPRKTQSASSPQRTRHSNIISSPVPPRQVLDASVGVLRAMEREQGKQQQSDSQPVPQSLASKPAKERLSDTSLDSNAVLRAVAKERHYAVTESRSERPARSKHSQAPAPASVASESPAKERLSDTSLDSNSVLRAVAKERQHEATESRRLERPARSSRTQKQSSRARSKSQSTALLLPPPSARRQRSTPVQRTPPPPTLPPSRQQSEPVRPTRSRPPNSIDNENDQARPSSIPSNRRTTVTASARTPTRPSAHHERQLAVEQTPGAVRVSGLGGREDDDNDLPQSRPSNEFNNASSESNRDLLMIEARLVEDRGSSQLVVPNQETNLGDLVQAQPLQEKEMRCRDAWKSKRMRRYILFVAFIMGAIIVAIVLGFTLTRRGGSGDNSPDDSALAFIPISPDPTPSPTTASPTQPPTMKPTDLPTLVPTTSSPTTVAPTLHPTVLIAPEPFPTPAPVQTSAPTVDDPSGDLSDFLLDYFEGQPPASLLESLKDPNSPQSRAHAWHLADLESELDLEQFRLFQRFCLAVFFYATNGESMYSSTLWLDHSVSECQWYNNKEACPYGEGYFSQLALIEHQLSGSLPAEFFWLTGVTWLDLSRNNIGGTLPTDIYQMSALGVLNLDQTSIGGQLPGELGGLLLLTSLYLTNMNNLSGTLPKEIAQLTDLDALDIQNGNIGGTIPTQFGRLSSLESLTMSYNKLTGMIPSELGRLTNLYSLNLEGNPIGGTIPSELGLLSNLQFLTLVNMNLFGSLPVEICNIAGLKIEVDAVNGACP